ncbi:hypothetical protein V8E36_000028 [Tilletia maclaganii]
MHAVKIPASFLLAAASLVSALPPARSEASLGPRLDAAPVNLQRRGSLGVGSLCSADADCITGWCAFPSEVGASGPREQRICRLMPAGGPCATAAQCTMSRCDPDQNVCVAAAKYETCVHGIDCTSRVCLDGACSPGPSELCQQGDLCSSGVLCPEAGTCPAKMDGMEPTSAWQNCVAGSTTRFAHVGWSVQSDLSFLRSERTFDVEHCLPFRYFERPCMSDGDCGTSLVCDTDRHLCSYRPTGRQCTAPVQCSSRMCGKGPRTLDDPNDYCVPSPAGSRCAPIRRLDCGSQSCSSSGLCATSEPYGPCFWHEDCPDGVKCDPVALTCGVRVIPTIPTTTTITTSTTTNTSTTTSSTTTKASTSTPSTSKSSSTTSSTSTSTKSTTTSKPTSTPSSTSTRSTTTSSKPTTTKPTTTTKHTQTLLPSGAPCGTNTTCQSGYCRAKLNADGTRSSQAYCDVKKASYASCYQNTGCLSGTCIIARGASNGYCK